MWLNQVDGYFSWCRWDFPKQISSFCHVGIYESIKSQALKRPWSTLRLSTISSTFSDCLGTNTSRIIDLGLRLRHWTERSNVGQKNTETWWFWPMKNMLVFGILTLTWISWIHFPAVSVWCMATAGARVAEREASVRRPTPCHVPLAMQ